MSPERWSQVKDVLEAALERQPDEREHFLDEVCASDPALRKEVDSLIAGQSGAEDYLENPPVGGVETFGASGGMEGSRNASRGSQQMVGSRLCHYKILQKLGSGGMGDVYLAEDTKLDRKVALKVLLPETARSESRRERFEREAKAIAALDHPNIVHVYSVEEAEGIHFITMQLVRGKTLTELIPKIGFSLSQFFDIAIPLTDAVAAAHSEGITHRDLKPDNVMITDDGRVKVLDFGLAKAAGGFGAEGAVSELSTYAKTEEGTILGTVAYMSPEQAEGNPIDHRSDIFSLGIVLYEMITGRRPFGSDTPAEVLSSIIKDESPTVATARPEVPRDLSRMVRRCLAKEPKRRLQSALDVRNELEDLKEALSAGELEPVEATRSGPSRFWLFGGAVGLSVAGAIFGVLLWSSERSRAPRVPRLTNPVRVTSAIGVENKPTWSPEGGRIAYESNQSGNWDVWVSLTSGASAVNLTEDFLGNDSGPSWSPDGGQIAFMSDRDGGGCFVMPAVGGTARRVVSPNKVRGRPAWSSDGSKLACAGSDEQSRPFIDIVTMASREVERLLLHTQNYPMDLSWSPDGRFFAYIDAIDPITADIAELWIVSLSDRSIALAGGTTEVWSPAWSADGKSLFYVSNRGGSKDLRIQELNKDGTPKGDSEPITTGLGIQSVSLLPNGTKIAYSKGGRFANLWRVRILPDRVATWSDAEQLTFDQAFIEHVDLSADGRHLVVDSNRGGFLDLWTLPVQGGDMHPLTNDPPPDWNPSWSPDGSEIVFYSLRTDNREVFIVPTDGGPMRRLTTYPGADFEPRWSPDGQRIVYVSNRQGNHDLFVVSAAGGEPMRLTEHGGSDSEPDWSPDGRWIAFRSDRAREGNAQIWRVAPSGSEPERLSERAGRLPRWAPDGERVFFLGPFGRNEFWALTLEDREERLVADLSGKPGKTGGLAHATDGEYLYFTWEESLGDIWVMDVVTERGLERPMNRE